MSYRLRRRRLPHVDLDGATYFVTTCLEGSIPALGLLDLHRYENGLDARRPVNFSNAEWRIHRSKLLFARTDHWLDNNPAVRHLADERLAAQVMDSIRFFSNERYDLISFVVMPSHMHVVFKPRVEWEQTSPHGDDDPSPRELIMHSLKRFTARRCNEILGRRGSFWQDESYDHCVRGEDELLRIIEYVELNPVKAGLVTERQLWRFSSATQRISSKIEAGMPLPKLTEE